MRIVVDVTPLSLPRTGIGNYVRGMLAGLAEAADGRHELVAFGPTGVRGRPRIAASLAEVPVQKRLWTLPGAYYWRALWSRAQMPPVERLLGRLDVFHFSEWMYPPQRAGVRATTVHDLFPLRFPDLVHPRTLRMHSAKLRNAVETCDVMFANSEFTANEVADLTSYPRERVRIAQPGIDPRFRPDGPRADLGSPYLLAVSTLEPRKNLEGLLAAFALLRPRRPELVLAVAGAAPPRGTPGSAPPQPEGVQLLGYVADEELARLYRGAAASVYPSLFEGFGIPIVEALACGAPVVASSHASLDEASGEAAFRADPMDPEALAEAIEQALAGGGSRREAGLRHASRFTWRACGEAVLRGYESVL